MMQEKKMHHIAIKTWTNKSLIKWDISKSCTLKKEVGVHTFNEILQKIKLF